MVRMIRTIGRRGTVHKDVFRFTYAMNYVVQVTVCMLTPAAIWIGLGWLCCNRWGVGDWIMIPAIILGVVTGFISMVRFLLTSARAIDPTEPDPTERKEEHSEK